jgi:rhodanese-related sulfurtransferase
MGWHLAGFELERGETRSAPEVSGPGLEAARRGAARAVETFGVRTIDRATYESWRREAAERTLYVFDVRGAGEFEAGHLPEARHAPGGQLVQATETYAAVRNARVVLVDDTFVRAAMTASWLQQLNLFEVAVLEDALVGQTLASGPRRATMPPAVGDEIAPADLQAAIEAGAARVIDFARSGDYRQGHIPGAWFAVRAGLGEALGKLRTGDSLGKLPSDGALVLTSPDGALARLAALEAEAITGEPVKVLAGGTAAWRAAGLKLEAGEERMASAPDDVWLKPYHHTGGVEARMKEYLDWEIGLVEQIERDGDARFLTAGD